jgi:hypothetical protein
MIAAMAAAVRTASTFCLLSGFEGASDAVGFCCGAGVECDAGVACSTVGVMSATGWALDRAMAAGAAGEWFAGAF